MEMKKEEEEKEEKGEGSSSDGEDDDELIDYSSSNWEELWYRSLHDSEILKENEEVRDKLVSL